MDDIPLDGSPFNILSIGRFFLTVPIGLESLLVAEIEFHQWGIVLHVDEGGVEIESNWENVFKMALCCSICDTIRYRLSTFRASQFSQLTTQFSKIPWKYFLRPSAKVKLNVVSTQSSNLYHTNAIKERLMEILIKDCNVVPSQDDSICQTIFVRNISNVLTISLGIATHMHKRLPVNKWVTEATMRETMASALLLQSRLSSKHLNHAKRMKSVNVGDSVKIEDSGKTPLDPHFIPLTHSTVPPPSLATTKPQLFWDPFCGSGTLPIEAWSHYHFTPIPNLPVNQASTFEMESWPCLPRKDFDVIKHDLVDRFKSLPKDPNRYLGSDIDFNCIQIAEHNKTLFQLPLNHDNLEFQVGDFERVEKSIPWNMYDITIVSNLPYGQRLKKLNLESTFKRLGKLVRKRPDIRHVCVLNGHPSFSKAVGMKTTPLLSFRNGGIPVQFLKLLK